MGLLDKLKKKIAPAASKVTRGADALTQGTLGDPLGAALLGGAMGAAAAAPAITIGAMKADKGASQGLSSLANLATAARPDNAVGAHGPWQNGYQSEDLGSYVGAGLSAGAAGLTAADGVVTGVTGLSELRSDDAFTRDAGGDRVLRGGLDTIRGGLGIANAGVTLAGVDPASAALQMGTGVLNTAVGVKDAITHGARARGADKVRKQAAEEGSWLTSAANIVGKKQRTARNDGIVDAIGGAINTADGAVQIAKNFDPSGTTAGVAVGTKVVNGVFNGGKAAYRMGRDTYNQEKSLKMRDAAQKGDRGAIDWEMSNDPYFATAQMMQKAQHGSDTEKGLAKSLAMKGLGMKEGLASKLGDPTARLTGFDNAAERRMKTKFHTNGLRAIPGLAAIAGGIAGIPGKIKAAYDGYQYGKQQAAYEKFSAENPMDISGPMNVERGGAADVGGTKDALQSKAASLSGMLNREKQMKADGASQKDIDAAWAMNVEDDITPNRAIAKYREYDQVMDFRAEKMHQEMQGVGFKEKASSGVKGLFAKLFRKEAPQARTEFEANAPKHVQERKAAIDLKKQAEEMNEFEQRINLDKRGGGIARTESLWNSLVPSAGKPALPPSAAPAVAPRRIDLTKRAMNKPKPNA